MNDQGIVVYFQMIQQVVKCGNMVLECIVVLLRFVGQTTAHMVRRNNPVLFRKQCHQFTVIEGPCGVAMDHDNNLPLPLSQIVEAMSIVRKVMTGKWILIVQMNGSAVICPGRKESNSG